MGKKWKLALPVPEENGVDYLVMEDDTAETGGIYIYYLSSTNQDLGFDSWHPEPLDEVKKIANEYGLSTEDWQPFESDTE